MAAVLRRLRGLLSAAALLKQVDEFFILSADQCMPTHRLELPPAKWVQSVTRLCSCALTAKQLPKAFQINPERADSRVLLTAGAAAAVANLQSAEQGRRVDHYCPLTGEVTWTTVL